MMALSSLKSGAVLLYIAEKSGKLIPPDFQGRMRVVQWCFAALTTVEQPLMEIQLIDKFGYGGDGVKGGDHRWSEKPGADWMGWNAGWRIANGSPAPISLLPTFSLPRFCGRSARPISSIHIPGLRPIMSGPKRARLGSARSAITQSG